MSPAPSTAALIVAAGRGERVGGVPKQYRLLGGKPVLRHALERFLAHPRIGRVGAVIAEDQAAPYRAAAGGLELMPPVHGGPERQESVRLGLEALSGHPPDRVLIHDAARPFVPAAAITRVLDALETGPAAITALPVADTLKRGVDGFVAATVAREGLWRAQTPQGFHYPAILAAHRAAAGRGLSDDAAIAELAGLSVRLVAGAESLAKITTEGDFAMAEARLAAAGETRTGTGFDTHRFAPGAAVRLCGVAIPHDRALAGHSDADVGLHALTDALLGAVAAGDIGQHFPPGDPRWRQAESAIFAAHARDLIARAGGAIIHVDITLICESPRIGPHREAMRARVADILGIETGRVSVKATTTEGLGFAGRGEGIAAQAVATVRLARPLPGDG